MKKLTRTLATCALALATVPLLAQAAFAAETYDLKILGVQVTSDNCSQLERVLENRHNATGKVSFEPASVENGNVNRLVLDNCIIQSALRTQGTVIESGLDNLTVVVRGDCQLLPYPENTNGAGILMNHPGATTLTITDDDVSKVSGSLQMAAVSRGIKAAEGTDLAVTSDLALLECVPMQSMFGGTVAAVDMGGNSSLTIKEGAFVARAKDGMILPGVPQIGGMRAWFGNDKLDALSAGRKKQADLTAETLSKPWFRCGTFDIDGMVLDFGQPILTYNGTLNVPKVMTLDGAKVSDLTYNVQICSGTACGVGKSSVKLVGTGYYVGTTQPAAYSINPKGTSLTGFTARSKGFTAKWAKMPFQITGYQIRYSTSSTMKSAKTVTIKGAKSYYKKVYNLKAKKRYYVQVRTYKQVNDVKYYSAWSAKKSVKTK